MFVKMSAPCIVAIDHCLANVEVSGMSVLTMHNKIINSLNTQCTAYADVVGADGKPAKEQRLNPCDWNLSDEEYAHVKDCVYRVANFGKIPGRLTMAYGELVAAFAVTAADIKPAPEAKPTAPAEQPSSTAS